MQWRVGNLKNHDNADFWRIYLVQVYVLGIFKINEMMVGDTLVAD